MDSRSFLYPGDQAGIPKFRQDGRSHVPATILTPTILMHDDMKLFRRLCSSQPSTCVKFK